MQKFIGEYIFKNLYVSHYGKKIDIIDNDFCEVKLKEKLKNKAYTLKQNNFKFEELYTDGTEIYYGDLNIKESDVKVLSLKNGEYREAIIEAKKQLIEEGIFNYKDVFIISLKYIKENPLIKKYIENRFECVIIDEMQDVRAWEYEVIEELFENVTFQKIGDPNQQIYDKTVWDIKRKQEITNSLRNSIEI